MLGDVKNFKILIAEFQDFTVGQLMTYPLSHRVRICLRMICCLDDREPACVIKMRMGKNDTLDRLFANTRRKNGYHPDDAPVGTHVDESVDIVQAVPFTEHEICLSGIDGALRTEEMDSHERSTFLNNCASEVTWSKNGTNSSGIFCVCSVAK